MNQRLGSSNGVLGPGGGPGALGPGAGVGAGGVSEVDRTRELEALPTQELERLVADDDAFTTFLLKWMQDSPVSDVLVYRRLSLSADVILKLLNICSASSWPITQVAHALVEIQRQASPRCCVKSAFCTIVVMRKLQHFKPYMHTAFKLYELHETRLQMKIYV